MIESMLGWPGSVKSKNFVPVSVWKHWRRNLAVSRTSRPEGWGRSDGAVFALVGREAGSTEAGVRERVMAWTLRRGWSLVWALRRREREGQLPVEGASKHEQVITTERVEALVELAVVDQAAGLVDNEKREDDPGLEVSRQVMGRCGQLGEGRTWRR